MDGVILLWEKETCVRKPTTQSCEFDVVTPLPAILDKAHYHSCVSLARYRLMLL